MARNKINNHSYQIIKTDKIAQKFLYRFQILFQFQKKNLKKLKTHKNMKRIKILMKYLKNTKMSLKKDNSTMKKYKVK